MNVSRILAIWVCMALLSACASSPFIHETFNSADLRARATTETEGPITVSAAVPSREETTAIFGIDLYDKGIQPVWLEVRNNSETIARYAPASTDRYYFPPQEIAYKNRKGYSDEARAAMQRPSRITARFETLLLNTNVRLRLIVNKISPLGCRRRS